MTTKPSVLHGVALLGMRAFVLLNSAPIAPGAPDACPADGKVPQAAQAAVAIAPEPTPPAAPDSSTATQTTDPEPCEKADLVMPESPEGRQQFAADSPGAVKPGPDDAVISCEGSMHFDASEGVLVYADGVRVSDPRFSLTGADELKVFLAKPAPGPSDKSGERSLATGGLGAGFDRVERIVATGAIHLCQQGSGKEKPSIEATAAAFSYDSKTGGITLSNGYPWVKQGTVEMRAKEPNVTLHIQQAGSFMTVGKWETELHYFSAGTAATPDSAGTLEEQ